MRDSLLSTVCTYMWKVNSQSPRQQPKYYFCYKLRVVPHTYPVATNKSFSVLFNEILYQTFMLSAWLLWLETAKLDFPGASPCAHCLATPAFANSELQNRHSYFPTTDGYKQNLNCRTKPNTCAWSVANNNCILYKQWLFWEIQMCFAHTGKDKFALCIEHGLQVGHMLLLPTSMWSKCYFCSISYLLL